VPISAPFLDVAKDMLENSASVSTKRASMVLKTSFSAPEIFIAHFAPKTMMVEGLHLELTRN
jgi:hypothetical protein